MDDNDKLEVTAAIIASGLAHGMGGSHPSAIAKRSLAIALAIRIEVAKGGPDEPPAEPPPSALAVEEVADSHV